jgi:hypothetical protein
MRRPSRSRLPHRPVEAANDNSFAPSRRDGAPGGIRDYLVLLGVIVGVALFYWLAVLFVDWDRVQTCVTMGKRTCVPPIELDQR